MKNLSVMLLSFLILFATDALAKDKSFPVRLMMDDFEDGDYTNNPPWEVTGGVFTVEDGKLVSRVDTVEKDEEGEEGEEGEEEDSMFEGYSWDQLTSASSEEKTGSDQPALIYTKTPLSNAFSLRLDTRFVGGAGKMVLGVYQVKRGQLGYRVFVNPKGVVRLIRLGEKQGRFVVAKAKLDLDGVVSTRIVWSRYEGGRHVVRIGGTKYLDIVDPYFKEPFDGFFVLNRKGEQQIDRVAARGTR